MTRVGIIGAGHIGSTLARGLVDRGYEVVISNSRGPEIARAARRGPRRERQGRNGDGCRGFGDVVIVTVPLKAYQQVPVEPLAGKIVLDTNNYYWERDGRIPALDEKRATTTGLLQEHLPDSKVAKAFNHIGSERHPHRRHARRDARTPRPRDRELITRMPSAFVTALYDAFGFDTVDVGPLAESWRVERDQPAYVVRQTRDELVDEPRQGHALTSRSHFPQGCRSAAG